MKKLQAERQSACRTACFLVWLWLCRSTKPAQPRGLWIKFCFERWIQQAALSLPGIRNAPDAAIRSDVPARKGSAVLELGLFLRDV